MTTILRIASLLLLLLPALLATGCTATLSQSTGGRNLTEAPSAPAPQAGLEPGHSTPLPRALKGAPPQIPHSIVDLTIDRSSNDCVDCHLEALELEPGHVATKIPPSHYDENGLSPMRYNCLQCHSPIAGRM